MPLNARPYFSSGKDFLIGFDPVPIPSAFVFSSAIFAAAAFASEIICTASAWDKDFPPAGVPCSGPESGSGGAFVGGGLPPNFADDSSCDRVFPPVAAGFEKSMVPAAFNRCSLDDVPFGSDGGFAPA